LLKKPVITRELAVAIRQVLDKGNEVKP
jgi:hypothetical protein